MTVPITIDTSRLARRVAGLRGILPAVRAEASATIAAEFTRRVVADSPRDTNRFVRAWAQAGNQSGATSLPLPPLVESQWAKEHVRRLEKQVEVWERRLKAAQKSNDFWIGAARRQKVGLKGRQRDLARAAKKAEEVAAKTLKRAVEELAVYTGAQAAGNAPIAIYGNTTGRGGKNAGPRRRLGITVRGKVYGGEGRVVNDGRGLTYYELKNLEAHARIVEKRTRVVARSLAAANAIGVPKAAAVFLRGVRRAWGFAG